MAWRVLANIADREVPVTIEVCDSKKEAMKLAENVTKNGFWDHMNEEELEYYPDYMVNSVELEQSEDVRY